MAMTTQWDGAWLRTKLPLVAVCISLGLVFAGAVINTQVAHAEAQETTDETVAPPKIGFVTGKTAIYREYVVSDAKYRTSADVSTLRFAVYETADASSLSATIDADRTVSEDGEYAVWAPKKVPEKGVRIVAQTEKVIEEDGETTTEWRALDGALQLREFPTISLDEIAPVGGATLTVRGKVTRADTALGTTKIEVKLSATDGSNARTQTLAAKNIEGELATFDVAGLATGTYRVDLRVHDGDRTIDTKTREVSVQHGPVIVSDVVIEPGNRIIVGDSFVVRGRVSLQASSTVSEATLLYGDRSVPLTVKDGAFVEAFPYGLAAGAYTFSVVVKDNYGNTGTSEPVTLIVKPSALPPLEQYIKPTPVRLSTDFITRLPTSRTVSTVARKPVATAVSGDVLGDKTRESLKEAIDLRDTAGESAPIEPTARGWSIFGVAWYWWLAASATVIGASVYVVRRSFSL